MANREFSIQHSAFSIHKKGWIGIDLGTRAVKLAQVERSGAGLRIASSVVMPRTHVSRDSEDAAAQDCAWSGRDLLAALSLNTRFSGRKVACTLPMHFTDLHALTVPPGEPEERRAMVAHELSSMFSGNEQQREFEFWETQWAAGEGSPAREDVNVLSVPRPVVARVVQSLSDAGLLCQVLDGFPFALARAVKLTRTTGRAGLTGAVHWGFGSGTFCVVSDGTPLFTRHLRNCGFASLAGAVGGALGVSEDEALQLLARDGLPGPDRRVARPSEIQNVIGEVAAHALNELVGELEKTISYLKMQFRGLLPERLCLLGDGAIVNNVTARLSEKVGIPVEMWQLPPAGKNARHDSSVPPAVLATAVALSVLAWTS